MHTITEGKAGSLVDSYGRFYKPLQVGPRGNRERAFYETLAACLRAESGAEPSSSSSAAGPDEGPTDQSSSSSTPYSQAVASPASPRMVYGRSSCEAPHAWQNLFSVRNAALLNVVPRFCTSGCLVTLLRWSPQNTRCVASPSNHLSRRATAARPHAAHPGGFGAPLPPPQHRGHQDWLPDVVSGCRWAIH